MGIYGGCEDLAFDQMLTDVRAELTPGSQTDQVPRSRTEVAVAAAEPLAGDRQPGTQPKTDGRCRSKIMSVVPAPVP
jgi:hypothetical protein